MSVRFDITRLSVRGFRSIASCDVELGPLTALVGPNGSGKSNFLDALRFTAQALDETLDNAVRQRGGIDDLLHVQSPPVRQFEVSIGFQGDGYYGRYSFSIGTDARRGIHVSSESCAVSRSGTADRQHFSVRDGEIVDSSESALPLVSPDRLLLVAASGLPQFRLVYEGLRGIEVYNISPDAMRQPHAPDAGDVLRRDGSNLASVVERLRNERPHTIERIEDYLGLVIGGSVQVVGQHVGSWETLAFRQSRPSTQAAMWLRSTSMSDGTLRALGVLVALFSPRPEMGWPVAIEEPEAALHPAAAGVLLDALRDASATRQVLITTHSPDLLDSPHITAEELQAVRLVDGATIIGPVDAAGQKALRESLYTAGELLRVDQLSPARPDPIPEEDG